MIRKRLLTIGKIVLFIILLFTLYCIWINRHLVVTRYTVHASVPESIRIVQLTDLHSCRFGKDNKRLVDRVRAQEPDIALMTGDMFNDTDDDIDAVSELIRDISGFVPVYYSYGNQEVKWLRKHDTDLMGFLEEAGAIVLNNEYLDITLKGMDVRIGGYMGYYHFPLMLTGDPAEVQIETDFANDFENTDRYKILLNHIPTQWVDWNYVNEYNVDLVFSGHYHGGVIQIPFSKYALYAPYVEWFPEHVEGVFTGKTAVCVLSTGLGSQYNVPRINNPPEIVVVDIMNNEQKE